MSKENTNKVWELVTNDEGEIPGIILETKSVLDIIVDAIEGKSKDEQKEIMREHVEKKFRPNFLMREFTIKLLNPKTGKYIKTIKIEHAFIHEPYELIVPI